MFLFNCENTFHQSSRRRIVVAEVIDHLAITIDCNTLSHEILFYHVGERSALDVFRVAAHQQTSGIEIGLALELNYALCNRIRVSLFVVRMLEKLSGHAFGMYSASHVIMTLIPQHTDDLGRQCLVQNFNCCFTIRAVTFGHSAILDVLSRAFAQSFDISEKWLISRRPHSLVYDLGEHGS